MIRKELITDSRHEVEGFEVPRDANPKPSEDTVDIRYTQGKQKNIRNVIAVKHYGTWWTRTVTESSRRHEKCKSTLSNVDI